MSERFWIRWLYASVALSLAALLLCVARKSPQVESGYGFLLKDKATGQTISKAEVGFMLDRDYPLFGQLTFLPDRFRRGWKNYSAKTSDGFIRLPSEYPNPEKWFSLKAKGYEDGPFNMEYIAAAYRNSNASNKLSTVPILYLERVPDKAK